MVKRVRNARPGNKTLAVGYVRVSTDDQALGPDAQRKAIDAYAAQHGLTVVSCREDLAVCGATPIDDCAGLLDAIRDVTAHKAGVLLVAKRDRLARDYVKAGLIEQLAARAGARVLSADGQSDSDDPAAFVMRGVFDLFAQYERAMIRLRTKSALAVKRTRGERISGKLPYGFKLGADARRLEPEPAEQSTLFRMRELRSSGLTFGAIAVELKGSGVRSRSGAPFPPARIWRMLRTVLP
jgi:DNA invertase Pin-like site-specific DNA recombinase